jgi:DNA-binding response OmpR family regulator
MVVDDDPECLSTIKRILTRNLPEFDIMSYSDPFRALVNSVEIDPAVILMDMMLDRYDGIKVIREIRKRGVMAPAIILTGYDGVVITKRICPENHIWRVINKCHMQDELISAINDAYHGLREGAFA